MKRMKIMLLSALVVLAQIVMFSSCSSEEENYLSSLPAESSLVIKVNAVQMVEKSNILNNPLMGMFMMQAESNVPESLKEKFEEIKQDPRSAGLDLEKPLAISVVLNDLNNPQMVFVAAISDGQKFDDLLTKVASTEDELTIEKLDKGMQRIKIAGNDEADIVYNDNRLLVTVGLDAIKLMNQSAKQSMLNNPNFKKFAESTNDYSIYMDYAWMSNALKQDKQLAKDLPPTLDLMKDCSIFCSVNFEQGKVVGDAQIYASDELKELQERFYCKPSGKFIGLLPENTYLALSGGGKNIAEIFDLMGEKEKHTIEKSLLELGLTKEALNTMEGEMLLGVFDDANPQGIPGFVLAVECKDRSLFDVVKKMTGNEATEGDVLDIMGYYITFTDGSLIATTKSIYDQCLATGKIKSLEGGKKNPEMDKVLKNGGLFVDFQAIAQNKFLNQMKRDRKVASALSILKQLDYLSTHYESLEEGSVELTFKDSSKNALEQLISMGIGAAMAN